MKTFFNAVGYRLGSISGWRFPEIPDMPRLQGSTPLGMLPRELREGRNGFRQTLVEATQLARQHERGVAYFWSGMTTYVVLTRTSDAKQLFEQGFCRTSREGALPHTREAMGPNIFFTSQYSTPEGTPTRGARKALWKEHLLDNNVFLRYEQDMSQLAGKSVASLGNEAVDLETFFTHHALQVLGKCLLDREHVDALFARWEKLSSELFIATTSAQGILRGFFSGIGHLRSQPKELQRALFAFITENIYSPENSALQQAGQTLLQAIIDQHKKIAAESDVDPRTGTLADIGFLFFSGHDTTAKSLIAAIKLLAANPPVLAKLREHLAAACPDSNYNYERIKQSALPYFHSVLDEVWRLYPPLPILQRRVDQVFTLEDTNGGPAIHFQAGDMICIDLMSYQRNPAIWGDDVEEFRPERIPPVKSKDEYVILPFGAGLRKCPGLQFSLEEIKLLLARLIMNFDIEIVGENRFETDHSKFKLDFVHPTLCRFIPRKLEELQSKPVNNLASEVRQSV